jgi:8-oxo-dGTP pyrophosphatase MutT (NUDIX family)
VAVGLAEGVAPEAAPVARLNDRGQEVIEAAGGLVWRRGDDGGIEILIVHRPKYDDWTLPKGKLDPGEDHVQAALREVEEETGLRPVLGPELPSTEYDDRFGRPKRVRYWAMEAVGGRFEPNREVDEVRWLPPGRARQMLSYDRDGEVLDAFSELVTGA